MEWLVDSYPLICQLLCHPIAMNTIVFLYASIWVRLSASRWTCYVLGQGITIWHKPMLYGLIEHLLKELPDDSPFLTLQQFSMLYDGFYFCFVVVTVLACLYANYLWPTSCVHCENTSTAILYSSCNILSTNASMSLMDNLLRTRLVLWISWYFHLPHQVGTRYCSADTNVWHVVPLWLRQIPLIKNCRWPKIGSICFCQLLGFMDTVFRR